ncbi:MAG: ABC transporter permease [Terrisporobacter sp.]
MGVKILFKNLLHSFKNKKLQLVSIGIIIGLSSFLYSAMFYTMDGLKRPFEEFEKSCVQEDFSLDIVDRLTESDINNLKEDNNNIYKYLNYSLYEIKLEDEDLYNKIIQRRISDFEKNYDEYVLENRVYKTVNSAGKSKNNKFIFYKDAKDINLSFIEEGKKPVKNNEIAVTKIYAKENNLNIGDKIEIKNKKYFITGYVLFPDVTLAINGSEMIIDNSKITVALLSNNEFDNIKVKEEYYLSGVVKGKNPNVDEKFKNKHKKILDTFDDKVADKVKDRDELDFITSAVLTKSQMRSGAIYEEIKSGQMATLSISIILSTMGVLIVLILVYKIINKERIQIGILKSLGYSRKEILSPYLLLIFFISLPTLIIGYYLGIYAANPLKNFYLTFYLLPNSNIETNYSVLLMAVIVPLIIILGLSYILIRRMLSSRAIDLIKLKSKNKISKLNKFMSKLLRKCSSKTRFKFSFIISNGSKFAVFFIGIVLSSMLITLGLMMNGFFEKMTIDYYNSKSYNYEAYVDLSKKLPKVNENEEKFISLSDIRYNNKNVSIKGLYEDSKLHKLYNKKNKEITSNLKEGLIVNKSFSVIYSLKEGDKIIIKINNKNYTKKIVGVTKDYGDSIIYWNIEELSNIIKDNNKYLNLKKDEIYFNGVYSKKAVNEEDFISVVNKNDIMDQSEMMQQFIEIAIYYMIICAIFIAVIVLYVLTTISIEDNYYNISLLKVMGYSKKEVNSMIINSYLSYSIISYLISIPVTVAGFNLLLDYFGKQFNLVMPFEYEFIYLFIGLAIIIVIFLLGTYAAKRRIKKVSLQEVLKTYQE